MGEPRHIRKLGPVWQGRVVSDGPRDFATTSLVILVADLKGYHHSFQSHSDVEMARFLDRFYTAAEDVVTGHDGRIVKFIGDAALSVFADGAARSAVAAATSLVTAVESLAASADVDVVLGANVHAGPVVTGSFGKGRSRQEDVIGRAVNQTFLLGRGAGIRVSDAVYALLPVGDRAAWRKGDPPGVYLLEKGPES